MVTPGARIFVAGHRGLAGSALVRRLRAAGHDALVLRTHAELDLEDQAAVRAFFDTERPDVVVLAAARVGGILANDTYPAQFIHRNLIIQDNVIHEAWRHGVQRLLFLGSSCIYPRDCPQPMREEHLLTGPLEATNRPYAVAKIAGIETCWAYNREYGTRYVAAMPTNLYGPGDSYDLNNSHVLPALLRKAVEARARGERHLVVWGSGTPRREFLYSDDMADACVRLLGLDADEHAHLFPAGQPPLVNVGSQSEVTIRELATLVARVAGFEGEVVFDASRPDGTPRKLMDSSRLFSLGWRPAVDLDTGIGLALQDFLARRAGGSL